MLSKNNLLVCTGMTSAAVGVCPTSKADILPGRQTSQTKHAYMAYFFTAAYFNFWVRLAAPQPTHSPQQPDARTSAAHPPRRAHLARLHFVPAG